MENLPYYLDPGNWTDYSKNKFNLPEPTPPTSADIQETLFSKIIENCRQPTETYLGTRVLHVCGKCGCKFKTYQKYILHICYCPEVIAGLKKLGVDPTKPQGHTTT